MKRVLTWDLPLSVIAAFTLSYSATFMFIIRLPGRGVFLSVLSWCLLLSVIAAARKPLTRVLPFLLIPVPFVWYTGAYEPTVAFIERYMAWIWAVKPDPGYERLSVILITFAVTVPVFILIRCRSPAVILLLAGGTLFFGLESAGFDYPRALFWGFLVSIMLQMAHTAGERPDRKRREPEDAPGDPRPQTGLSVHRNLWLPAALPVCLAAALLASLFVNAESDPLGFFRGSGGKFGFISRPGNSLTTDVTGVGREMGGPFNPSGQLMLTLERSDGIDTGEGPYLRGGVGMGYDGRRWYGGAAEGLDLDLGMSFIPAEQGIYGAGVCRIAYERLRGTRLFLPYGTFAVFSRGWDGLDLAWYPGDTLRLREDPGAGLTYITLFADDTLPLYRPRNAGIPEDSPQDYLDLREDPGAGLTYITRFADDTLLLYRLGNASIPEDSPQDYLDLPEDLPYRVYQQSVSLTRYGESYYNALAIERYLVENFPYNPNMPQTPADRDFVDYFLFEQKEGYCTYFATAMAVLCRASGIPARYVDGFAPSTDKSDTDTYLYTDERAHAWVEVWLEEYGAWVQFEPTPGYNRVEGPVSFPEPVSSPQRPVYPEQSPPPEEPSAPPPPRPSEDNQGGALEQRMRIPWKVILPSALPPLLLYCTWLTLRLRRRRFDKMLRSMPYGQRQVKRIYKHLLWLISHANIAPRPHETLGEFADRADEAWPTRLYIMRRVADVYSKSCYSPETLSVKDSETLRYYVEILERREHIHLGPVRYKIYTKALSLIAIEKDRKKNDRPLSSE